MRKISVLCVIAVLAIGIASTSCGAKSSVKLKSDLDSASYLVGVSIGTQMRDFPGGPNIDVLIAGLKDAFKDDSLALKMDQMQMQMFMQSYFTQAQTKDAEKTKAEGDKYLAAKKKEAGVDSTASGLLYKVEKLGDGPKPTPEDRVRVNYVGKLIDGKEFDKSDNHPDPNGGGTVFGVNQVIPGWTEGLQLMPVGSKYIFYIPSQLAYGERGNQGIKPNSVLVFDVELLEIIPADSTENN
ncbi:MAG: FKBP-type peptidyl-prolyl cis-trans isomerase [Dysgonamonadaceae bacterium]|jgi:FKBP-type peptidyl-prolyl cis-trans isomerase FkpA/FKBP-type peptidyl-prolyl cis-trans isomerase FklB|nr:FKBP-type peptidyl-prolyl cis-trans isomerase [Dysgonamonadaceae bacterium]